MVNFNGVSATVSSGMVKTIGKEVSNKTKNVTNSVKDGAKLVSKSQDAMASQGKAMVKKSYVSPKVDEIKLYSNEQLMAGSNTGSDHGYTGGGITPVGPEDEPFSVRHYDIWERGFGDSGSNYWE